jgi:hypothetical protein
VAQNLFRTLALNSFRMNLHLLENDMIKTGKTYHPVPQANQLSYIQKYIKAIHQPSDDLIDRVLNRLHGKTK